MSNHRIIGALMVLNAKQFLEQTLEGVINRIRDINAIVIFDGAWVHSGYDLTESNDGTQEIIKKIIDKYQYDIQIMYQPAASLYRNPSEKRNAMLRFINNYWELPYHVFWFDDDEEIRFTTGREQVWLRDSLKDLKKPSIIPTYGWDSERPMWTPRFIPGGQGYHWHTENAMCLHDSSCNVVVQWNPKKEDYNFLEKRTYRMQELFMVNKWPLREAATMENRKEFAKQEEALLEQNLPCQYRMLPPIES